MISRIRSLVTLKSLQFIGRFSDRGDYVWSDDWDVLVVLDACRVDELTHLTGEFDYLSDVDTRWSVGGMTAEWMEKTFAPEFASEMRETGVVVANPFSEDQVSESDVAFLDEVWRYEWDDEVGTVHPDDVTAHAVHHHRERNPERMLVHYLQPHTPFVEWTKSHRLSKRNFDRDAEGEGDEWTLVQAGELSAEEAREAYRDNLRLVLESVGRLLRNVTADVVAITADHGEFIGEWGIYGHSKQIQRPALREVPWAVTDATDEGTYEPDVQLSDVSGTTEEKLHDLGYLGG